MAQDRELSVEAEDANATPQKVMCARTKELIAQGVTDHCLLLQRMREEFGGLVSKNSVAGILHRYRQGHNIPAPPSDRWTQKQKPRAMPDFSLVGTEASLDDGCSWVIDGRGFCGSTREPGKPYCFDHCMVAYPQFAERHPDGKVDGKKNRKKRGQAKPKKQNRRYAGRLVMASGTHI